VDDQSYMLSAVPVWKFPSPNFGYTMCQTVVKSCVKVVALSGSCAYVNRETKYGWCQYVQLKRAEHQERTERTSWLPLQEASKLTSMMKHLQRKHSMGKGTLRWHYEQGLSSLPGNCRQRIGNNLVLISGSKWLLGECPLDIASVDIHWTFPFLVTTEPTVEPFVSEMLSWEWFCMLVPARWNYFKVVNHGASPGSLSKDAGPFCYFYGCWVFRPIPRRCIIGDHHPSGQKAPTLRSLRLSHMAHIHYSSVVSPCFAGYKTNFGGLTLVAGPASESWRRGVEEVVLPGWNKNPKRGGHQIEYGEYGP